MPIRDNRNKPYSFIRFGTLSPIKQKFFKFRHDFYHAPPVRHGFFSMPINYLNMCLVFDKVIDFETMNMKPEYRGQMKRITHKGKVWTHYFHPSSKVRYYRQSGSWYETTTDYVDQIIAEEIKYQRKLQGKHGMFDNHHEPGKGTDLAKIKQMDSRLLWEEIEFFIERI